MFNVGHYRFLVGLSDLDGAIVYNTMTAPFGSMKPLGDNGAVVFPRVMADIRGGAMTLVATLVNEASGPRPIMIRHTCRYGAVPNAHIIFKASVVRATETDTSTAASDKTTVGGKVGASYGIASGELSGSREHQGEGGSVASSYASVLKDITVVWSPK